MSRNARHLGEARAARDSARSAFDAQLLRVRGDPEAQSLGGRMVTRIEQDARAGIHQALEMAGESKGISAGTIAVLALWFLRNPLIAWVGSLLDDGAVPADEFDEEKCNDQT